MLLLQILLISCASAGTIFPDTITPPDLYLDPYPPFYYGVASGDPYPDSVVIWTRRAPNDPYDNMTNFDLEWEISTSETLTSPVSGAFTAMAADDWTAQLIVTGLNAKTYYYYRWKDVASGNYSRIGRTKTGMAASETFADDRGMRLAVLSCSSIYSGYYYAFRHLAARDDVEVVLHLGDTVYDTVDKDELVLVPSPCLANVSGVIEPFCALENVPTRASTIDHYRSFYRYNLLNADYRDVRARHPIIAIADNHDVDNVAPIAAFSFQVFTNYWPGRWTWGSTLDRNGENIMVPLQYLRKFRYGNLVDIIFMDEFTHENSSNRDPTETVVPAPSLLGETQKTWFKSEILTSKADGVTWRCIPGQKPFTRTSGELIPGYGTYLTTGGWDGYPGERTELIQFFKDNYIVNNVWLGGDMHIGTIGDVIDIKSLAQWNQTDYCPMHNTLCTGKVTKRGSIGTEVMPPSVSRGNFDEMSEIDPALLVPLVEWVKSGNPHHHRVYLTEHGYGEVTFYPRHHTTQVFTFNVKSATYTAPSEKSIRYSCSWNYFTNDTSTYHSNYLDEDCSCKFRPIIDCVKQEATKAGIYIGIAVGVLSFILVIMICAMPAAFECACCAGTCTGPAKKCGCVGCCSKSCCGKTDTVCICCSSEPSSGKNIDMEEKPQVD